MIRISRILTCKKGTGARRAPLRALLEREICHGRTYCRLAERHLARKGRGGTLSSASNEAAALRFAA